MASINIYVTDELKERMSGAETNWSEVCRRAIEVELNQLTLEAEVPNPSSTQGDEDWKQITFDQSLLDQGVIVKLYYGSKLHRNQPQRSHELIHLDQ